jgi:HAD superfamily hydrolase (TIGR01509 family)
MSALIFDCDGVLVDAEVTQHRRAFNQVWAECGVRWRWSERDYRRALRISGGRERLEALRDDPAFRAAYPVPADPVSWYRTVRSWHHRKTAIYTELVRAGEVKVRTGVRRLAAEAHSSAWRLAVASSGARESVTAVMVAALGDRLAEQTVLISGESVAQKKPAAEIYKVAADALGVEPDRCVAIEDSAAGIAAAVAAGMTCVATPTRLTILDDFSGAALVMSGLGDPGRSPEVVLGGTEHHHVSPLWLGVRDLEALFRRAR